MTPWTMHHMTPLPCLVEQCTTWPLYLFWLNNAPHDPPTLSGCTMHHITRAQISTPDRIVTTGFKSNLSHLFFPIAMLRHFVVYSKVSGLYSVFCAPNVIFTLSVDFPVFVQICFSCHKFDSVPLSSYQKSWSTYQCLYFINSGEYCSYHKTPLINAQCWSIPINARSSRIDRHWEELIGNDRHFGSMPWF